MFSTSLKPFISVKTKELCLSWNQRCQFSTSDWMWSPEQVQSYRWSGWLLCIGEVSLRGLQPAAPPGGQKWNSFCELKLFLGLFSVFRKAVFLTSEAMVKPMTSMQPSSWRCGSKSRWSPVFPHGMVPAQYLHGFNFWSICLKILPF